MDILFLIGGLLLILLGANGLTDGAASIAKRGGHTPQQRAEMNAAAITELGKRFNLQPDSVYIESSDIVTDLMYGNKVLSSFTDQDGLWEG